MGPQDRAYQAQEAQGELVAAEKLRFIEKMSSKAIAVELHPFSWSLESGRTAMNAWVSIGPVSISLWF